MPDERLRSLAMLALLTAVLPEMLSGNTPAEVLFRPATLLFVALAYGLPVLAIREWAVRRGVGAAGLMLAGMAYGVLNEGLLAKTIFRETGMPVDVFDGHGHALGINWPWTMFIIVWHGLSSVLLPVLLVHHLWPDAASRPWLGPWVLRVAAAVAAILASLYYLGDASSGPRGTPGMLVGQWAAMGALVWAGARCRGGFSAVAGHRGRIRPVLLGLAGLPAMVALLLVARAHAPVVMYAGAMAMAAALAVRGVARLGASRPPAGAWMAWGWYAQVAALSWIGMLPRSPITVLLGATILALLAWALSRRRVDPLRPGR